MAERLSRKAKYQELRDQIEQESMATQVEKQPVKLSRVQNSLSHANRAPYPHEDIVATKNNSSSQVMEDLLGEVKQYNINNGNRYTDDTQINILKQLDTSTPNQVRNQHIMPMEEDELGSTMEMPNNFRPDSDGVMTFMPNQKLTRVNPVNTPVQPEIYNNFDEEKEEEQQDVLFEDFFKDDQGNSEKIVLGSNDIRADDYGDTDHLDLFEPGKYTGDFQLSAQNEVEDEEEEEVDPREERKARKAAKKAAKKAKKEAKKAAKQKQYEEEEEEEEEVEIPSAKIRMKEEDNEEYEEQSGGKSGIVLNVILGLLIIALLASIAFTVYFLYNMGL